MLAPILPSPIIPICILTIPVRRFQEGAVKASIVSPSLADGRATCAA